MGEVILTANTYLNFFEDTVPSALFISKRSDLGWDAVDNIQLPVLSFSGTLDSQIRAVINPLM